MKKLKKKGYWHYLLKYSLITALIVCFLVAITVYVLFIRLCDSQEALIARDTRIAAGNMERVLKDMSFEEGLGKCLTYCVNLSKNCEAGNDELILLTNSPYMDGRSTGFMAITDMDTGEIVYEEKPGAILSEYDETKTKTWEDDSMAGMYYRQDLRKYYYCDDASVREIYDLQKKALQKLLETDDQMYSESRVLSSSSSMGTMVDDFYVKGNRFLPGKVYTYVWKKYRSNNGELKEFEFKESWEASVTPPADYEHVFSKRIGDTDIPNANMIFIGMQENRITDEEKEHAYELMKGIYNSAGAASGMEWERGFLIFPKSLTFVSKCLFIDPNGKVYNLMVYEKIDQLRITGALITNHLSYLMIVILIPFVLAWVEYSRKRYLLMTDGYRNLLMDSMAHDLKSPLMAISGYVENLKENLTEDQTENAKENLYFSDRILSNVSYMNEIVNQNLDIIRYSREHKRLSRKDVNIRKCFEEAFERYQIRVDEKKLKVLFDGELTAKADVEFIQKVIDNLVTNAIKYTQEESNIEVSFYSGPLNSGGFRIANHSNHDINVNLKRLWEPLVRGDESRNGRGNGMGLAIVSNILDRHKWKYKLSYDKNEKLFTCSITIPKGILF